MTDYQIYVDLDGVLADFELLLFERYGLRVNTCDDAAMWEAIAHYDDNHGEWFYDLQPMHDAHLLWDYVKKYNPTILTATGRREDIAAAQKRKWVLKQFEIPDDRIITVRKSEMKAQWAKPNAILIDDNFPRSITSWTAAGGIGIIRSNARLPIAELKRLGL